MIHSDFFFSSFTDKHSWEAKRKEKKKKINENKDQEKS